MAKTLRRFRSGEFRFVSGNKKLSRAGNARLLKELTQPARDSQRMVWASCQTKKTTAENLGGPTSAEARARMEERRKKKNITDVIGISALVVTTVFFVGIPLATAGPVTGAATVSTGVSASTIASTGAGTLLGIGSLQAAGVNFSSPNTPPKMKAKGKAITKPKFTGRLPSCIDRQLKLKG